MYDVVLFSIPGFSKGNIGQDTTQFLSEFMIHIDADDSLRFRATMH